MKKSATKDQGDVVGVSERYIERFSVGLHRLDKDAVELWPDYLIECEGRPEADVDRAAWNDALMRDVYRYGPIVTKHTDAWMFYRASQQWSRELVATADDFIDMDDPEGPISRDGASLLAEQSREDATRKLAWLASWLSSAISHGRGKVLAGLSKIALAPGNFTDTQTWKVDPNGVPDGESVRGLIGCSPEEGLVVNAFLSGWDFHDSKEGRKLLPPTVTEIKELLDQEGARKDVPDIRKILKKFGLVARRARPGRPRKKERRRK